MLDRPSGPSHPRGAGPQLPSEMAAAGVTWLQGRRVFLDPAACDQSILDILRRDLTAEGAVLCSFLSLADLGLVVTEQPPPRQQRPDPAGAAPVPGQRGAAAAPAPGQRGAGAKKVCVPEHLEPPV